MLILAGVSLNAIVGDNGILTQAQNATVLQGCSVLSGFLNEIYLDEELDKLIEFDNDGTEKTPLEKVMQSHPNWFYSSGSYNYVISDYEYEDESGNTKVDFLMLRLINIDGLSNDSASENIAKQLKGGKADINGDGIPDDEAYQLLKDVYGVTDDLQVYYCSDGLKTAKGADYTNTSFLDGTKVVYDSSSSVAKAIAETNGTEAESQTLSSLRSNTELVVSDAIGVTNLSFMYDLPNIQKLTLKNYTGSLQGLEKSYRLRWLYFQNENGNLHITDWSSIKGVKNLSELYFYMPTDEEVDNMCSAMSSTDYTSLQTLGVYGYLNTEGNNYRLNRGGASVHALFSNSQNSLEKLSDETKSAIRVLYLGNSSISGTLDLSGFSKISQIYLGYNYLSDVPLLPSSPVNLNLIDFAFNNIDNFSLEENIKVTKLYLEGNNLGDLTGIIDHGVSFCAATSIDSLDFSKLTDEQKIKLQTINLRIDSKYALAFPTYETIIPTTVTENEFRQIKNSSTVKKLKLSGCSNLSNDVLQEVLNTLRLSQINLDYTKISSLDCLTNSSINAISIRGTAIKDLTPILARNIGLFRLNNAQEIVNFYNTSDDTYKTNIKAFFNRIASSSGRGSSNPIFDGYGNGGLCTDKGSDLSLLIKTFEITKLYANYENGRYSGDIDVSSSVLQSAMFDYSSGTISLPSTMTYLDIERGRAIIKCPSQNFTFYERNNGSEKIEFTANKLEDVIIPSIILRGGSAITPSWKDIKIETLKYFGINYDEINYGKVSFQNVNGSKIDGILNENLTTNINNMYISSVDINSLSILERFNTTENMYIWNCKVKKIDDFLTKNNVIKKLYLTKNLISDVSGLENGDSLEYLDLSYNTLTNYTTLNSGTKLTANIIAELPNLKYVSLQGNEDITNFGELSNESIWENDGNNNFTKIQ